MRFPREKILFAVDFIPVNSYSFRDFPDAYMPDWIESLRRVEAMEFDVLAPGHGPPGTKANVTMFREYLQDLRTDVIRYTREGKSVDEMKQLITLPKYAAWGPKEWFPPNIEGMHRLRAGEPTAELIPSGAKPAAAAQRLRWYLLMTTPAARSPRTSRRMSLRKSRNTTLASARTAAAKNVRLRSTRPVARTRRASRR